MFHFIFGITKVIACVLWVAVMVFLFVIGAAGALVLWLLFGGFVAIMLYKAAEALVIDILEDKEKSNN